MAIFVEPSYDPPPGTLLSFVLVLPRTSADGDDKAFLGVRLEVIILGRSIYYLPHHTPYGIQGGVVGGHTTVDKVMLDIFFFFFIRIFHIMTGTVSDAALFLYFLFFFSECSTIGLELLRLLCFFSSFFFRILELVRRKVDRRGRCGDADVCQVNFSERFRSSA